MARVLIGKKTLGPSIGDMGKPIRDGDGDGKCQEHDGKFIPCPPGIGDGSILGKITEQIDELDGVDLSIIGGDPEDASYELMGRVRDDWTNWRECRDIRQAAYDIVSGVPSGADPHISRTGRNLFGDPRHPAHMRESDPKNSRNLARFLLNILGAKAQSDDTLDGPLYRAVMLSDDQQDNFDSAFSKGKIVDIPLVATATQDRLGANPFLTRYGSDVLIKIEDGSVGHVSDPINTLADQELEDETIDILRAIADDFEAEGDYGDLPDLINDAIDAYQEALQGGTMADIQSAKSRLVDLIEDNSLLEQYFFAGDVLDEGDPTFWDQLEGDRGVREVITGGRFVVQSVEKDKLGVYKKIVTLRQVGVFDPRVPGSIIPIKGARQ